MYNTYSMLIITIIGNLKKHLKINIEENFSYIYTQILLQITVLIS